MSLHIVPMTFRQAAEFVGRFHRHNKPPRGCKFCIGVADGNGIIRGVAMCGRPIARAEDNGFTLEINRTCTDGYFNANSMLYGASRQIAKAMGYERLITYTQSVETGASLRAAGFVREADIGARESWAASTADARLVAMRDPVGNGGVARVRWSLSFKAQPTSCSPAAAAPAPRPRGSSRRTSSA